MDFKKLSIGQSVVKASDSPADKIKTAMDAIGYLVNGVYAWEMAHGGDKQLAKENGKKVKQAEELLAQVLATLPGAFTYHVYGLDKEMNFKSAEDLIKALAAKGIKHTGNSNSSPQRRVELHNQPTFDKLIGPMFDGAGKIRYETQETYDVLSR